MRKKDIPALVANILSYAILFGAWIIVAFGMCSVAFNAYYMEDILIWYEKNFGNIPFNLGCGIVLILICLCIVYVLTMQEKHSKKRVRLKG